MGKKIPIEFPEKTKARLEQMSDELMIPQASLVRMAVESMVANYEAKGSFILVDMLNPEHRSSNGTNKHTITP
jgi:predicted DNA-binding protein